MVRVVGGEWGRDGPSLFIIRDVVWWRRGRRQIELCERVGEERVLTVGGMGWRGGRGYMITVDVEGDECEGVSNAAGREGCITLFQTR